MIDLYAISSLPISFDPHKEAFIWDKKIVCKKYQQITIDGLIPALLNKALKYPEVVYKEGEELYLDDDSEVFASSPVKYEVIVLPPGLLGIEFIKSHIYFSPETKDKHSCVVECLYGILTILIQKNKIKDELDFETVIEEGVLIKLRKGEKIAIPTGYFYTFINTKDSVVIFSRVYRHKGIVNYDMLSHEKGLGYFAIRKNARTEIVFNPRYRTIPKLCKQTPGCDKFKAEYAEMPLYESVKKNVNFFIDTLLDS